MKHLGIGTLILTALVSAVGANTFALMCTSRGLAVPLPGYSSTIVVLILAALTLILGLKVKRYMEESNERESHPVPAARQHSLDMTQGFRIIVLARAASLTGAIIAGASGALCLYMLLHAGGTLGGAVVPSASTSIAGIVLAVVGLIVQQWGTIDPPASTTEAPSTE